MSSTGSTLKTSVTQTTNKPKNIMLQDETGEWSWYHVVECTYNEECPQCYAEDVKCLSESNK